VFFSGEISPKCEFFLKLGIFRRRFLEILKKNRQKSSGFEMVSPDLEALLLWVTK
jgi:hypothetical protein